MGTQSLGCLVFILLLYLCLKCAIILFWMMMLYNLIISNSAGRRLWFELNGIPIEELENENKHWPFGQVNFFFKLWGCRIYEIQINAINAGVHSFSVPFERAVFLNKRLVSIDNCRMNVIRNTILGAIGRRFRVIRCEYVVTLK